jgi:hypothetical protein
MATSGATSGGVAGAGNGGTGGGGVSGTAGVGTSGHGGALGGAATGGSGGAAGQSGASGSGSGNGGGGGSGGAGPGLFSCSEVVGGKLVGEFFAAGFETLVDSPRWQARWKEYAEVQEWAKPSSDFWNAPIESACSNASNAPERVLFMIFSWSLKTQADWTKNIKQTVDNFKTKFPSIRRLDLMTQVVAPGNQQCPTPPAAGETIVVSPELQASLTETAAAYPGYVYLAPRFEARTCADLQGGGPHLNTQGNTAVAAKIAAYVMPAP